MGSVEIKRKKREKCVCMKRPPCTDETGLSRNTKVFILQLLLDFCHIRRIALARAKGGRGGRTKKHAKRAPGSEAKKRLFCDGEATAASNHR